jgi:glycosyltransferase involved in cell wall biosynthesis
MAVTMTPPILSIIMLTPDNYETLKKVVACYRRQTIVNAIEIVIVTANSNHLNLVEEELLPFHSYQVIEHIDSKDTGAYKSAAVNAAKADIVVFGEDHAYPLTEWAERLVDRHGKGWAAVGPLVINPNPQRAIAWAQAYMEYGPWLNAKTAGQTDYLPGHNSSFKRDDLLAYGSTLSDQLNSEYTLFQDLREKGKKLYFEENAKIKHLNFEKLRPLLMTSFYAGKNFAAFRARRWNWAKKLLYIIGSPIIPAVRLTRILEMRSANRLPENLSAAFVAFLLINLTADTFGQLLGYLFGIGGTKEKLFPFEFHRTNFLLNPTIIDDICE